MESVLEKTAPDKVFTQLEEDIHTAVLIKGWKYFFSGIICLSERGRCLWRIKSNIHITEKKQKRKYSKNCCL